MHLEEYAPNMITHLAKLTCARVITLEKRIKMVGYTVHMKHTYAKYYCMHQNKAIKLDAISPSKCDSCCSL